MTSVSKNTFPPRPVLLLYGLNFDRRYFTQRLDIYAPNSDIYAVYIKPEDGNMQKVFEECCQLIEKYNIKLIINGHEIGSMLHSALASHYSLPGTSFLASFLTASKRYTREVIGEPLKINVPFAVLTEKHDPEKLAQILAPLPSAQKIIAKPIFESASRSLKVMANKDEVLSADFLASMAELRTSHRYLLCKNVIKEHMSNGTYNFDQGYMIEQYVSKNPDIATFHGVDGLVYKKSFIPWCIRDHLFWTQRRECHIGNAFPSSLPSEVQERVWEVAASIANKLIEYGFDHQFFEAEVMVFKTGRITLMEINGRIPMTMMSSVYTDVLNNGDPTATILAMADEEMIEPPTFKKDLHGIFAYISTLKKGKVSDFIDVDKAHAMDCVELLFGEDTIKDGSSGPAGANMAIINCTGSSRKACLEKAKDIVTELTKVKETSPWFTDEYM